MGFMALFFVDKKERGIWTVHPLYRIFFSIITAVIIAVLALHLNEQSISFIEIIILLLCLGGVTLRDAWIFDYNNNLLTYISGFGFLTKKITTPLNNIDKIQLVRICHGREKLYRMECVILTKDGTSLPKIEEANASKSKMLQDRAKKAADYLGLELEIVSI